MARGTKRLSANFMHGSPGTWSVGDWKVCRPSQTDLLRLFEAKYLRDFFSFFSGGGAGL